MKTVLFVAFLAVVPALAAHLPGTPQAAFPGNTVALRAVTLDEAPISRAELAEYERLCEHRS